jgi:FKBP-type peptidyl-prolyl cis-trans isomerase
MAACLQELQKKSKTSAEEIAVLNKELTAAVRAKESLQAKVNTLEVGLVYLQLSVCGDCTDVMRGTC